MNGDVLIPQAGEKKKKKKTPFLSTVCNYVKYLTTTTKLSVLAGDPKPSVSQSLCSLWEHHGVE